MSCYQPISCSPYPTCSPCTPYPYPYPCPPPCPEPCPVQLLDTPHVISTNFIASTLAATVTLPGTTWSSIPIGTTGSMLQTVNLVAASTYVVNSTVTSEPGVTSSGVIQYRLLVDGLQVSQGSAESATDESHIMSVSLNAGGMWQPGIHTVDFQYRNIELNGNPPFFNATAPRGDAEGATLTTSTQRFVLQ